jgi:hypothetical protein
MNAELGGSKHHAEKETSKTVISSLLLRESVMSTKRDQENVPEMKRSSQDTETKITLFKKKRR